MDVRVPTWSLVAITWQLNTDGSDSEQTGHVYISWQFESIMGDEAAASSPSGSLRAFGTDAAASRWEDRRYHGDHRAALNTPSMRCSPFTGGFRGIIPHLQRKWRHTESIGGSHMCRPPFACIIKCRNEIEYQWTTHDNAQEQPGLLNVRKMDDLVFKSTAKCLLHKADLLFILTVCVCVCSNFPRSILSPAVSKEEISFLASCIQNIPFPTSNEVVAVGLSSTVGYSSLSKLLRRTKQKPLSSSLCDVMQTDAITRVDGV